jgi:hypothetical protein
VKPSDIPIQESESVATGEVLFVDPHQTRRVLWEGHILEVPLVVGRIVGVGTKREPTPAEPKPERGEA